MAIASYPIRKTVITATVNAAQMYLRLTLLLATCVSTLTSLPVAASEIRIPSVTRLVRVFSQLESRLSEAVRKRDKQTVSDFLTRDFEMRVGTIPGNPIPRADWLRQSFAEPGLQSSIEQMAVHDYNKVAVVSFMWTVTSDTQPTKKRQIFIVDTWRQESSDWKLAVRYAAAGGKSKTAIPAGVPPTPLFEKKE